MRVTSTSQAVMATIKSARPIFRNNNDRVAFAVHAFFLVSGFDLTATGRPALANDALSSSSPTQEVGTDGWNEFDREYAFVYTNPEKRSKKVLVKCLAIGDKLVVDALADGETEPLHLEIQVRDYADEPTREGNNYAGQYKNLGRLVAGLNNEILDELDGQVTNQERGYYNSYLQGRVPLGPQIHPSGVVVPPIPYPFRGAFGDQTGYMGGLPGNGGYSDLFPSPLIPGNGGYNDLFPGSSAGWNQTGYMGLPLPDVPPPDARFYRYGSSGVPGFVPSRFTMDQPTNMPHYKS